MNRWEKNKMCVIVHKPKNISAPKAVLRRCFLRNQDGMGFWMMTEKGPEVSKGFFKFKDFWKAIKPHMDKEMVLHFRYTTAGHTSDEMCHPFPLGSDRHLFHNGTVADLMFDEELSDTYLLAQDLWGLNNGVVYDILDELAELGQGRFIVTNEHMALRVGPPEQWNQFLGMWFSNMRWNRPLKKSPKKDVKIVQNITVRANGKVYTVKTEPTWPEQIRHKWLKKCPQCEVELIHKKWMCTCGAILVERVN